VPVFPGSIPPNKKPAVVEVAFLVRVNGEPVAEIPIVKTVGPVNMGVIKRRLEQQWEQLRRLGSRFNRN